MKKTFLVASFFFVLMAGHAAAQEYDDVLDMPAGDKQTPARPFYVVQDDSRATRVQQQEPPAPPKTYLELYEEGTEAVPIPPRRPKVMNVSPSFINALRERDQRERGMLDGPHDSALPIVVPEGESPKIIERELPVETPDPSSAPVAPQEPDGSKQAHSYVPQSAVSSLLPLPDEYGVLAPAGGVFGAVELEDLEDEVSPVELPEFASIEEEPVLEHAAQEVVKTSVPVVELPSVAPAAACAEPVVASAPEASELDQDEPVLASSPALAPHDDGEVALADEDVDAVETAQQDISHALDHAPVLAGDDFVSSDDVVVAFEEEKIAVPEKVALAKIPTPPPLPQERLQNETVVNVADAGEAVVKSKDISKADMLNILQILAPSSIEPAAGEEEEVVEAVVVAPPSESELVEDGADEGDAEAVDDSQDVGEVIEPEHPVIKAEEEASESEDAVSVSDENNRLIQNAAEAEEPPKVEEPEGVQEVSDEVSEPDHVLDAPAEAQDDEVDVQEDAAVPEVSDSPPDAIDAASDAEVKPEDVEPEDAPQEASVADEPVDVDAEPIEDKAAGEPEAAVADHGDIHAPLPPKLPDVRRKQLDVEQRDARADVSTEASRIEILKAIDSVSLEPAAGANNEDDSLDAQLPEDATVISFEMSPGEINLPPDVEAFLKDHVLGMFSEHDGFRLEIHAYATPIDGEAYSNVRLSLARALEVRRYLMERDISPARLKLETMGKNDPLSEGDRIDLIMLP